MFFDEEFIKSLPEDILSAIEAIYEKYSNMQQELSVVSDRNFLIIETFAFIAAYSEANSLGIDVPPIVGDLYKEDLVHLKKNEKSATQLFQKLRDQFSQKRGQSDFEQYKNMYATRLGKVFHYEFSEGDLNLIQNLINELRQLISTTKELEEGHRHRLTKKLEKVQSELHKRVSDLDRFWGVCLDLSIVIGLMGENAKPAADLVKKIVDIIWPVQTRAYELPSSLPFKLLGQAENDKSKDKKS